MQTSGAFSVSMCTFYLLDGGVGVMAASALQCDESQEVQQLPSD